MRVALPIIAVAVALVLSIETANARGGSAYRSGGSHSVRAYVTKRGTYVAPHHATNRNTTKLDNWSTRGNVNPFTGKSGTRTPY